MFEDYPVFVNPADGNADMLLLLEELGQLCLLVTRRRFSSFSIPREQPHLEKYRSWMVAQARNAVISLALKLANLDNVTILARIQTVVSQLAETSAAPMAKIIDQICRHMGELLSGRALDEILSETPVKGQETSFVNLEWTTMDIGADSDEQDVQRHRYDLIMASDMLRTSANMQSLTHLGESLRPDGRLVVHELGSLTQWVTYVFGSQLAWWCREDQDRRERQLAAVGLGIFKDPIGDRIQYLFTMIMSENEPEPRILSESLTCRQAISLYDEPASVITEQIIEHLKENGYRVTRSTFDSRELTGQDIISVESLDDGCATVSVVYNQQWR